MNPDALIASRRTDWERLDELAKLKKLTGEQAEELLDLYRRTGADLAYATTSGTDPLLQASLSQKMMRARRRLHGQAEPLSHEFRHFFLQSLPVALWRLRWVTTTVAVVFLLICTVVGVWVATSPDVLDSIVTDAQARKLVDEDFVAYYSDGTDVGFFTTVWFNNSWLAILGIALGVTGIYPLFLGFSNAFAIGQTAGVMAAYGGLDTFFIYISPHGFLELTAIFTSIAAGLRLAWAWMSAGKAPRSVTLATEGRAFGAVSIGLVLALLLSGIVEAFITPSGLPAPLRIILGFGALAAYLYYAYALGRPAAQAGKTGDIDKHQAGSQLIYSA